jgi:xanthine dehydrogenase iron-sulfur cluster and FAD-binding subunit A
MSMVALTVNERSVEALAEPRTSLADFVRETLDLTGTHLGCEHGVCGACTVLLDGVPARSCITYAVACEGAAVTTKSQRSCALSLPESTRCSVAIARRECLSPRATSCSASRKRTKG